MRNRGVAAALVVVAVATACGSLPANAVTLARGTIELAPSLGFSHESFSSSDLGESSFTTLTATGVLGYCLSDQIEVSGGLLIHHQSYSEPGVGSVSTTSIGATGGVQYNFGGAGRMVPFARSALGVVGNSSDVPGTTTTFIAPILQAGLRWFVGSSASINYGIGYQRETNARGTRGLSADAFSVEIGLSIFPRVAP